ncbi:MAG: alanine dehydrogenase [Gammaproteobacteria bacterium]|nr:alanine dehydrogenase [Gammaproteobacteria bacterium]
MGNPAKYSFSEFFSEGQYATQTESLVKDRNKKSITIGIPNESDDNEQRVALVPNSIRTLIGYGHRVIVETGAGLSSNFSDHDYSEAGASIAHSKQEVFKCDVLVKIAPPTVDEIDLMRADQILISPIQLPSLTGEYLTKLKQKRVTALAMEYLQGEDGSFHIVRIMSEIAGMCSIITAAELLHNTNGGRGVLLGGISGVPPAKVVVLGAGVVGEFATKTALGLGASVRIFDNDISKLMRLQSIVGRQLHTSVINPVYLGYQLMSADVVIGAIHSTHGRTPIIVTEEMVTKMKEGSVIIDVSIDQGGCVETSEMTTHSQPTFVKHGITHYCVPNISSKVGRTASVAVSNIITPLLLKSGESGSIESLLYDSAGIRNGCYTYKGCLTNEYLSKRFDLKYTSLNLLLTSNL